MNHFNHHHVYRHHHHHHSNPAHPVNPMNPIYHHHRHHHDKDSDTTLVTTVESNQSVGGDITPVQGGVLVALVIGAAIIAAMFLKHLSKD